VNRRQLAALAVAAPWVLWAVVRIPGLDLWYPLVPALAFTPYVALTSPVPVVVALLLRERVVAAGAAIVAVALVGVVAPRALDGPAVADPAAPRRPLVAMTLNMRYGSADPGTVVRLVRDYHVDVLALEELTPGAVSRLDAAGIRSLLPGRVLEARKGAAGSGLMARGRLRRTGGTPPPAAAEPEAALGSLRLKVVHPYPPISPHATRAWGDLLRAIPGPRAGMSARLVLGDFNGTLDNREIRRLLDRGYVDAADAVGAGLRWTYPAGRLALRLTIDHVLVPRTVAVRRVVVRAVPGSDHRALIAELGVRRSRAP
jgi:endonuclease/exonuclease/phosphatase (EEP) superfamily protein YafD